MNQPLLSLRGITKIYPAVIANQDIDLDVYPGQIHAILGENGAGKSTLMKIIYGSTQPDAGTIHIDGNDVKIRNPAHARSLGIGMVFQHFSLFETLTVAQNVSMAVKGSIRSLSKRIIEAGDTFGLPIDPDTLVYSLSVGERQRVEIIRCILQDPRLLIMDEPTSVLPPSGVTQLFTTLRRLRDSGCSILYISHKLEEIRDLCDSATILRDGKVTGRADPREESNASLARMMIGRDIPHATHPVASTDGAQRLQVNNLVHQPDDPFATSLKNISLNVKAGEVVGIAGVSGNGQEELMRLISGEEPLGSNDSGDIIIESQSVHKMNALARRRLGLCFVPEDRLGRGAVGTMTLAQNGLLTGHRHGLSRAGFVRFKATRDFANDCIEKNDVRCNGVNAVAHSLSGGNLQKFIVGRELELKPKLLVVSQPTWGVDVGAAAVIRQRLIDLREDGVGILIASEELEELFEVTDRLYVMFNGRLSDSITTRETNVHDIGEWMTGLFPGAREAVE